MDNNTKWEEWGDVVFLDTETTGLSSTDEVVSFATIDDCCHEFYSLCCPTRLQEWPEAQAIHGISPEDVQGYPSFFELLQKYNFDQLFRHRIVVVYNAAFDTKFFPKDFFAKCEVRCAMKEFAKVYGEWSSYFGSFKWQKLTTAVSFFDGGNFDAHNALSDCRATRFVFTHLLGLPPQEIPREQDYDGDDMPF